jgi:hypothetical protein
MNASAEKTVLLDPRIYKPSAIKSAIKDYSHTVEFESFEQDGKIVIKMRNYPEELSETLAFEFCNYVLWKLKN